VRSEFWLVFAAKTVCHFAGDTPENLIRRVNHVPFARNLMGFCGKCLHDRSKNNCCAQCFFPACNVRIEARAGSPCSSSAGTNAEKPWIIKEIPASGQNLRRPASRRKKTRTSGSGLIHQRRRVEETCGGCLTAATNENDYMSRPCATQEYLHCEMRFHNVVVSMTPQLACNLL
jgi:hypothetical protein